MQAEKDGQYITAKAENFEEAGDLALLGHHIGRNVFNEGTTLSCMVATTNRKISELEAKLKKGG